MRSSLACIRATAVIENSPYALFSNEEWESLKRFITSKEHLQKNVENITFCSTKSSEMCGGVCKHFVNIELAVKTKNLWETPRSYIWRNIGQDSWNRGNGSIITLTRIHQKIS